MLQLTRLSGPAFALNPDLIERAEATPDTVVTLVNGSKYVIRESLEELIEMIRDYRAALVFAAQSGGFTPSGALAHNVTTRHPSPRREATSSTVVMLHPGEE